MRAWLCISLSNEQGLSKTNISIFQVACHWLHMHMQSMAHGQDFSRQFWSVSYHELNVFCRAFCNVFLPPRAARAVLKVEWHIVKHSNFDRKEEEEEASLDYFFFVSREGVVHIAQHCNCPPPRSEVDSCQNVEKYLYVCCPFVSYGRPMFWSSHTYCHGGIIRICKNSSNLIDLRKFRSQCTL